jgi:predicted AAA+ superfamily ATPase
MYKKDPSQLRREIEKKIERKALRRIFIDEIQRIPELLNEVHYLIEKYKCQFILTGSSARKLKKGAVNLLAGRAFTRHLYPIVYEELKEKFDLDETLKYGSLPLIFSLTEEEKRDFLKSYAETYLKEEIQAEALVRNLGGFVRFLEIVASQCGQMVNFSSIGRDCMLPNRTVQSYFEILEDTLVVLRLDPWRKSIRKRLTGHPKYYLFDIGVTNSINNRLHGEIEPQIKGHLFEQFIILETYRMISYSNSDVRIFYWRTKDKSEVDLVFERRGEIIAGVEIKSSAQISSADMTGLKSLREDYSKAEMIITSRLPNSFNLDFATVMSFIDYITWLKNILKF